jgi:hypothetical protein
MASLSDYWNELVNNADKSLQDNISNATTNAINSLTNAAQNTGGTIDTGVPFLNNLLGSLKSGVSDSKLGTGAKAVEFLSQPMVMLGIGVLSVFIIYKVFMGAK